MRRRSLSTFLLLSSSFVSLPIYLSTSIISNLSPIINLPHLSSSLPFYIYHIQPFSYYQPTSSLFLSTFQHLSYPTFLLLSTSVISLPLYLSTSFISNLFLLSTYFVSLPLYLSTSIISNLSPTTYLYSVISPLLRLFLHTRTYSSSTTIVSEPPSLFGIFWQKCCYIISTETCGVSVSLVLSLFRQSWNSNFPNKIFQLSELV